MTTKRSAKKAPAKKKQPSGAANRKRAAAAQPVIPSPVEVLGEVGATLTEKQRQFAHLLAANPNQARAYRMVSPDVTDGTARTEGYRWANKPEIAELVAQLRAELLAKFDVTNERIIEEYARCAFFDIADIYGEDGQLLPIHDIPEHARRAIVAIEVDEIEEWSDERDDDEEGEPKGRRHRHKVHVGYTRKVKTVGKREALQDLAKIRKMLTDKVELSADASLAALIVGTPVV